MSDKLKVAVEWAQPFLIVSPLLGLSLMHPFACASASTAIAFLVLRAKSRAIRLAEWLSSQTRSELKDARETADQAVSRLQAEGVALCSQVEELKSEIVVLRSQVADGYREMTRQEEDRGEESKRIGEFSATLAQQLRTAIGSAESAVGVVVLSFQSLACSAQELDACALQAINGGSAGSMSNAIETATESMNQVVAHMLSSAKHTADVAIRMQEMESMTEKLHQLIEDIEKVADKTNVLSLNASIEAARAGEAGAGFAVIAQSIRGLAAEASASADRTKNLIDSVTGLSGTVCEQLVTTATSNRDEALRAQREVLMLMASIREVESATQANLAEVSKKGMAIADDVSQIVTGLQFYDLLRQRLEHIHDPLMELAEGRIVDECESIRIAVGSNLNTHRTADSADDGDITLF